MESSSIPNDMPPVKNVAILMGKGCVILEPHKPPPSTFKVANTANPPGLEILINLRSAAWAYWYVPYDTVSVRIRLAFFGGTICL